jgi:hypothetical protein
MLPAIMLWAIYGIRAEDNGSDFIFHNGFVLFDEIVGSGIKRVLDPKLGVVQRKQF